MGFDVVGVGQSSVDYVSVVPSAPGLDMKVAMERFTVQGGGAAATAVVACARMGLSTCLLTRIGNDTMGLYQRSELLREGVDVSFIPIEDGATSPFSFVMVEARTRKRIIVQNAGDVAPLREEELSRPVITAAGCLLLDPYQVTAGVRAAMWARETSIPVLFHADDYVEGVSQLVPMADYLIAQLDFAKEFAQTRNIKKAIDFLLSFGPRVVLLITESRGCLCATRTERFEVPPFGLELVDTTGARNVFHGACALGLLRGWDLRRVAEFATAASAIKCTALGGRDGIPRLAEVERFLLHHRSSAG